MFSQRKFESVQTAKTPPMIRFLLDEHISGPIVRGLRARQPDIDMLRAQGTELSGADDSPVLEWTRREGRVLLTHDLDTRAKYASERIEHNLPMASVILVPDTLPVPQSIDDLLGQTTIADEKRHHGWYTTAVHSPLG